MVNSEFVAPASRRLSGRHLAIPLIVLSLALQASTVSIAKTKRSPTLPVSDSGYKSALAAANRFLQAWQNHDHETGLLMLTDVAKQGSSPDRMESFFSSGNDAAYEIARGRKLKPGRYSFPVTLFVSRDDQSKPERPQKSDIVVVLAGKDEWAIDKLP
jgi:hypothetical protein